MSKKNEIQKRVFEGEVIPSSSSLGKAKEDFGAAVNRYSPNQGGIVESYELTPRIDTVSGHELLGLDDGWIIGARGNEPLRFPTEKHMLTIGSIGSGKGTSVAIPNMTYHEGSAFLMEMSTTTYKHSHDFRRTVLKQKVYLIDPWGATSDPSETLNLLDTLFPESPEFYTDAISFANTLMKDVDVTSRDGGSAYFDNNAKELLTALLIYVKTSDDVEGEDRNLPHLFHLISSYGSDEWNETMQRMILDTGKHSGLYNKVGGYYYERDDENVRSIFSSMGQKFMQLLDPQVTKFLKKSSFSLSELKDGKTTVYVVAPNGTQLRQSPIIHRLLVERTIAAYPYLGDGGKNFKTTKSRLLMMLDEFAQLGKVDGIDDLQATVRAKGITIWPLVQSFSQLKKIYGEDTANSIWGEAGVIQILETHEPSTLRLVSEYMGDGVVIIPQVQQTVTIGNNQQFSFTDTISATMGRSISDSENIADGESYQKSKSLSRTESNQKSTSTNRSTSIGTSTTTGTSTSWQESFGTTVNTNFIQPGMKAGDVNYKGVFGVRPNAKGGSVAHSYNYSLGGGSFESVTTNEQTTIGESESYSYGTSKGITDGETTGENRTVSKGSTKTESNNESRSEAKGRVIGENESISYAITYTTQIIPNMKPAQIEDALANDNQLLIVRGKGEAGILRIVERKAHYYEIPCIAHRVYGPPVKAPPMVLGNLIPPKSIGYFPAVEIKINIPQIQKIEIIQPREGVIDLINVSENRFSIGKSGIQKYLDAREKVDSSQDKERKKHVLDKHEKFLEVAQDIQSTSLSLSIERDQQEAKINKQWAALENVVDSSKFERVKLLEAKMRLEKKFGAIQELEQTLGKYQANLLADMEDEGRYEEDLACYQRHISYIHDLRKGWKGFDVPERPLEILIAYEVDEWRDDDLRKFITAVVEKFSKAIPEVPDSPVKPDRVASPEYSIPLPVAEINSTRVELKSGVRVSLEELNSLISDRKGTIQKIRLNSEIYRTEYLSRAPREELEAARNNFVDLIERETFRLLSTLPEEQKEYASWQKKDADCLGRYLGAVEYFHQRIEQLAEQYRVLELNMDIHWEYLGKRFEELNHANMILQVRRHNLHNDMQKSVVWDGLEAQTKLLLENNGTEQSLQLALDIGIPDDLSESVEFDNAQNMPEMKRPRGHEPEMN